jgi:hypothetical protein
MFVGIRREKLAKFGSTSKDPTKKKVNNLQPYLSIDIRIEVPAALRQNCLILQTEYDSVQAN